MRILGIILASAVMGIFVGGAVGYIQVRNDLDAVTQLPGDVITSPAKTTGPTPRAEVDEAHYMFGSMQRGTKKSHEFIIRNVGEAPLKLTKGTATCKCTEFIVPEALIPPQGSAPVRVEWVAKSENGPFRQVATVFTSDPLNSKLELTIEGQIMAPSGIEPSDFAFDKIPVGESRTAQVYVMAMLQDELTVSDPVLSDPATRERFDVKIEPVDPKDLPNKSAKRGVRISLTAKAGMPIGRFTEWLSVKTNLDQAEALEIPVSGQVVGDIGVVGTAWSEEQGAIKLGSFSSSDGRKEKVYLSVRGEDAKNVSFKVESVDPPEMKVTLGEPRKLKDTLVQVPLEVEIPKGTRPMVRLETAQGEAGKIILSTTHPKVKEMAVGVRFAVER